MYDVREGEPSTRPVPGILDMLFAHLSATIFSRDIALTYCIRSGKAQLFVEAFPESVAIRRASGFRKHKGREIRGSGSLVHSVRNLALDHIFVRHFKLYSQSKLWALHANFFVFPKGPSIRVRGRRSELHMNPHHARRSVIQSVVGEATRF